MPNRSSFLPILREQGDFSVEKLIKGEIYVGRGVLNVVTVSGPGVGVTGDAKVSRWTIDECDSWMESSDLPSDFFRR